MKHLPMQMIFYLSKNWGNFFVWFTEEELHRISGEKIHHNLKTFLGAIFWGASISVKLSSSHSPKPKLFPMPFRLDNTFPTEYSSPEIPFPSSVSASCLWSAAPSHWGSLSLYFPSLSLLPCSHPAIPKIIFLRWFFFPHASPRRSHIWPQRRKLPKYSTYMILNVSKTSQ